MCHNKPISSSVVVNVMLSLMSVMSPHPALCNLSTHTVVRLCTLGVFDSHNTIWGYDTIDKNGVAVVQDERKITTPRPYLCIFQY